MIPAENDWVIETRDLARYYGENEQTVIKALDGVNLRIRRGELAAIMGPSGSGKSTLLHMLGSLDSPTRGEVWVNGQNLAQIKNRDAFRARTVGFMFQLHNLLPTLTARENIEVPMTGLSSRERRRRAEQLLELVGLPDRMQHLPGQLSGGQRQRVAVARALANNPPIILADEPTGSLDTAAGSELMTLLKELNASQGVTFIVVTHDLAVARETRRVLVMQDGRIVREDLIGSPLEEDLKIWRHSGLGQRLANSDLSELGFLGLSAERAEVLKEFLSTDR